MNKISGGDCVWREYDFHRQQNDNDNGATSCCSESNDNDPDNGNDVDVNDSHTPQGSSAVNQQTKQEQPFTFDLFGNDKDDDDDEEDNMLYFTFGGTFVQRTRQPQSQSHTRHENDDDGSNDQNENNSKDNHSIITTATTTTTADDGSQCCSTFKSLTLTLSGESLCGYTRVLQSTGLAVWSGEDLSKYFIKNCVEESSSSSTTNLLRGKCMWELGAGTGLLGMVAIALGASRVVLTDGDSDALRNLRHNIRRNIHQCLGWNDENSDDSKELIEDPTNNKDNNHNIENKSRDDFGKEDWNKFVHCPQLIWGDLQTAQQLLDRYGHPDVLVACDAIYMTACLDPFFQTVSLLLSKPKDYPTKENLTNGQQLDQAKNDVKDIGCDKRSRYHDHHQEPLLYFMNTCPSQVTYDEIQECASRHNLEEVHTSSSGVLIDNDANFTMTPQDQQESVNCIQAPLPPSYPHLHIFRLRNRHLVTPLPSPPIVDPQSAIVVG